jgi:hypothetical protein
MMNQTNSTIWTILCERENCNRPAIGVRIRERNYIEFDFDKFFSDGADFLSMNKLVLFFMFFFHQNVSIKPHLSDHENRITYLSYSYSLRFLLSDIKDKRE